MRNVAWNSFEQDPSGFLENLNGRAHHDDGEQKRDYRIDEFRLRLVNRKANKSDETALIPQSQTPPPYINLDDDCSDNYSDALQKVAENMKKRRLYVDVLV